MLSWLGLRFYELPTALADGKMIEFFDRLKPNLKINNIPFKFIYHSIVGRDDNNGGMFLLSELP